MLRTVTGAFGGFDGCGGRWLGGSASSRSAADAAASMRAPGLRGTRRDRPTGDEARIGQTATAPYKSPDSVSNGPPPYKLQVTVEAITHASLSDFKGLPARCDREAGDAVLPEVQDDQRRQRRSGQPGGAISGVDNTGQDASSITFLGSFPPCNDTLPPKPFTHARRGAPATCTWSRGITSAHYNGFVQSYIGRPSPGSRGVAVDEALA